MSPWEEIIVVRVTGNRVYNEPCYLYRQDYVRWGSPWHFTGDLTKAKRFKSTTMAEHRCRTLRTMKEHTKGKGKWEVVKIYIPATPPESVVLSSSATDTPLHRLAKVAE